ncbi:3-isopropylmalate dehydratase small subunit [Bosea caraganae]|uniref:3-isopropylmalate dehydratase small subunit n=1 Tax=Bosea caraganae TaxID=2763117 RepID=A0A370L970_9HYPH|nr:3-isopropylmalate dehydratase small subunit [Bosea caraganae]RDJ26948.1 3-isopropylmalate dehydratase small subunit [Bosea caraganae]RDJ30835.1 3-isopropylmalate dehydratase small subunit [Bosea caraganae]
MDKFTQLRGVAAVLPQANVDTDQIIPKQFLTTTERTGLGKGLFYELRYDPQGVEIADFELNREPFRQARILVAGENFGCGSSREHAVWALLDFGIRCVIAPSFAAIFQNNCLKNGILLIALPPEAIERCLAALQEANLPELDVDLERRQITLPGGTALPFQVDEGSRTRLLEGLDDIEATLRQADEIARYAGRSRQSFPWLWRGESQPAATET